MKKATRETAIRRAIAATPLLSTAATRLLELRSHGECDRKELVDIVKHDSLLTAQVLKVVNSAAFGRVSAIFSIEQAVNFLGEDMVISSAMSQAAAAFFAKKLEGYAAEEGELWRHDLKTAIAGKLLAGLGKKPVNPEQAFTCGLLHDLGKVLLSDFLKDSPAKIVAAVKLKKIPDYLAAEKGLLGIDHAEAGYELCRKWNLPAPLPQVTRWHHQPGRAESEYQPLCYVVHLADILAMMSGSGTGADAFQYSIDRGYADFIAIDEVKLALVLARVEMEYAKVAKAFWGGETP